MSGARGAVAPVSLNGDAQAPMFIIIVGGGKVGTYLARGLLRQHHEVIVIEKDAKKAQMMTNTIETDIAIVGDGCDPNVLVQAGIARADFVIADTGDDEDNLVVVLIAKKHSKARCIARVNNPKNKLIFESLDTQAPVTVISSTELILAHIDERLNNLNLEPLARIGKGELELVQLSIPANSPARGRRVAELSLPRGCVVVALDRGAAGVVIPNGDTVIDAGDDVVAMIKRESRGDVCAALIG